MKNFQNLEAKSPPCEKAIITLSDSEKTVGLFKTLN